MTFYSQSVGKALELFREFCSLDEKGEESLRKERREGHAKIFRFDELQLKIRRIGGWEKKLFCSHFLLFCLK